MDYKLQADADSMLNHAFDVRDVHAGLVFKG